MHLLGSSIDLRGTVIWPGNFGPVVDLLLQCVQLPLHLSECFPHLGQLAKGGLTEFLIPFGRCRIPDDIRAGGNVIQDARFAAEDRMVANMDVILETDLSGNDHMISRGTTARDAHLRAEDRALADHAVVVGAGA